MNKVVYGNCLSGLIFYNKLADFLRDEGYSCNPYDECTWNKQVKGSQMTVQFFVNDLMVSHWSQEELEQMIERINAKFKTKTQELSVTRGDVHDYLGITIDYSNPLFVRFTMYDFLEDILSEAEGRRSMKGTAVTPATEDLFKIDRSLKPLKQEEQEYFHRTTARFLFVAKRSRPDVSLTVGFLCTRVKDPNKSDYMKLARLMRYMRRMIHLPLCIS